MLSSVELTERVRSLNITRRLGYSFGVALAFALAFWLCVVLGVGLAVLLVLVLVGGPLTVPDDIVALALPVSVVFMFAVGLSGLSGREPIAGQDILQTARRAARRGFFSGLVAGVILGAFWAVIIQANPIFFAVIIGLAVAPPLALFRGVSQAIEPVILKLVSR